MQGEKRGDIQGVFGRSDEELLVCDCRNGAVKSLRVWSNEVTVVFKEAYSDWNVYHAREMQDAAGDLLVVLEVDKSEDVQETRVCLARKQAEKYQTVQKFDLDHTLVVCFRISPFSRVKMFQLVVHK